MGPPWLLSSRGGGGGAGGGPARGGGRAPRRPRAGGGRRTARRQGSGHVTPKRVRVVCRSRRHRSERRRGEVFREPEPRRGEAAEGTVREAERERRRALKIPGEVEDPVSLLLLLVRELEIEGPGILDQVAQVRPAHEVPRGVRASITRALGVRVLLQRGRGEPTVPDQVLDARERMDVEPAPRATPVRGYKGAVRLPAHARGH